MATHSSSNRDAIRTFVVVALSLLVLVAGGMDFRRIWTPIGVFGFQANGDEEVIFVLDGSPTAKAGMQVGDIIDLRSTPLQSKYFAVQAGTLTAGQSATFGVTHRGARRILTLTAIPQVTEAQPYYTVYRIAVLGVALLYIFLGAALVLLRPSLMTWGFCVYCLANAPFTFYSMALLYPFPWPYVGDAVQWCLRSDRFASTKSDDLWILRLLFAQRSLYVLLHGAIVSVPLALCGVRCSMVPHRRRDNRLTCLCAVFSQRECQGMAIFGSSNNAVAPRRSRDLRARLVLPVGLGWRPAG